MISLRLLLAGSILFGVLCVHAGGPRRALAEVRGLGAGGLVLALTNSVFPFTLIAWGEKYVDSGIAAIANASVPIFIALLAVRVNPAERPRGLRLVGVLVGLLGVGVLAGFHPTGGWWAVAGILAITLASLCYAVANLFTQARFMDVNPIVIATATHLTAAFLILPFGLAQLPDHMPGWKALGSVAALGILGTALASLVHYRMVTWYRPSRTMLVSYLLTGFALFYGVVVLGESLTLNAVLGVILIFGGVALGSGLLSTRRRRTEPVPAAPAP